MVASETASVQHPEPNRCIYVHPWGQANIYDDGVYRELTVSINRNHPLSKSCIKCPGRLVYFEDQYVWMQVLPREGKLDAVTVIHVY